MGSLKETDNEKSASEMAVNLATTADVGLWHMPDSKGPIECSSTFPRLLKSIPQSQLELDSFFEAIDTDDRGALLAALESCCRDRSEFSCEFRLVSSDEPKIWLELRGGPVFGTEGQPAGVGGTLFAIAEARTHADDSAHLIERERQLREAAEASNRVKDEFVALVSHELRAPLNAMLGWARILQTKKVDAATLQHAVETIERSARAQSKLIEDLIDSTRIATGKLRLEVHPVDLKKVVLAAVDIIRPAAEAKQLTLNTVIDRAPLEVVGDADRLQQVVGNLLSNAVKFTPGGGLIEVELRSVDGAAEVIVTDSGVGINAELLPRIFDRFDQAGHSNTRRHGGLGLGLSLVRQLVELHGGSVRATSPGEGKGATFVIRMRLRVALSPEGSDASAKHQATSAANGGRQPRSDAPLSGYNILVVDDDPDARDLTTMLLRQNGANVRPASSAAEAFSALAASADSLPDLLLSDIGMPDEDGYSLITRVRELPPSDGGYVPAIALTAFGSAEDRSRAYASGFDLHLTKPIEPNQLVAEIARLAAKGSGSRISKDS
jgi:signal transduction histidine kinase/ActR/RegA family two-component response regulator